MNFIYQLAHLTQFNRNPGVSCLRIGTAPVLVPLPEGNHIQPEAPGLRLVVQRQVRGLDRVLRPQSRPRVAREQQTAAEADAQRAARH